jgi:hypothetical protein
VSAIERAERDEHAGDLGTARMRLMSFVATGDAGPDECERIARLSVRMGDPVEAGRWYFLCDSRDEQAAACIERFLERHGAQMHLLRSQIPARMARNVLQTGMPAAAAQRLRDAGIVYDNDDETPIDDTWSWSDKAVGVGCLIVVTGLAIACVTGIVQIIAWIGSKL